MKLYIRAIILYKLQNHIEIFMSHHEIKECHCRFLVKIERIFKFLCRPEIHHSQFDDAEVWSMLLHTFWYII